MYGLIKTDVPLVGFEIPTSLKGRVMKVIEHFDQHNSVWLRAVLKTDTAVAQLSNTLMFPHAQLYEVWLVPEDAEYITPAFLDAASFNSPKELLKRYQFEQTDFKLHAAGIEGRLVSDFGVGLHPTAACFHCSLLETQNGPVISVVFGSHRGMEAMYNRNLRTRVKEEISYDCSD